MRQGYFEWAGLEKRLVLSETENILKTIKMMN